MSGLSNAVTERQAGEEYPLSSRAALVSRAENQVSLPLHFQ